MASQAAGDHLDRVDPEDHQDQLDQQESKDRRDPLARPVKLVIGDLQVILVEMVQQDHRDSRESEALVVLQAHLDPLAQVVPLVRQGSVGNKVGEDSLVPQGGEALLDPQDLLVPKEKQAL